MDIDTKSGSVLSNVIYTGTKHEHVLEQANIDEEETVQVDDPEDVQHKSHPARGKDEEVKENKPLPQIPRPPHSFPQRLRKKAEDGNLNKFHHHVDASISKYSTGRILRADVRIC